MGTISTMLEIPLAHNPWTDTVGFGQVQSVPSGMALVFTNHQPTARIVSAAVPAGGSSFDSGTLNQDERFTIIPAVPGIWQFVDQGQRSHRKLHRAVRRVGTARSAAVHGPRRGRRDRSVRAAGDLFQTVIVNQGPQSVALTSPRDATGLFELEAQPSEMLLPFEGLGVDTTWELRMPRAANFFDYSTIADVLLTIEYTALDSFVHRQQRIQELGDTFSTDRPFSFRHQFADPWYDLHNPDQTATPMVVRFKTRREDFPPNIENLKIQHVVLYFARKEGTTFEVPVGHLHFMAHGGAGPIGGGATSIDSIISTRKGNAGSWTAMLGKTPIGEWELALPNTEDMKNRFGDEEIEDILLVITYKGHDTALAGLEEIAGGGIGPARVRGPAPSADRGRAAA